MKRVVITGIGIWSCLGTNLEDVAKSLRAGRSGIIYDKELIEYGMHCPLHGDVRKPDLKPFLKDRRLRACMAEEAEYAYMASLQALEQSGIDDQYLRNNEVGIIFGNDSSARGVIDAHETMEAYHDTAAFKAGMLFQALNSSVTMNLASAFHLRGINTTMSSACASGGHSIGIATMFIRNGLQDMILVGGAQESNKYAYPAFEAIGAFTQDHNPETASKPFDKHRTGLVCSGGAAALVLEEYEHAIARGANILAEVIGYGFSGNGLGISEPGHEGAFRSMMRALNDAAIQPAEIDYINAHATSTIQGDQEEAIAVTNLFGENQPWISSTKSMTGHECWMAGASELVYSILMMQGNFIAPNINFSEPDETAKKLNIVRECKDTPISTVMSNSFGFGGTNSTIIIKKI